MHKFLLIKSGNNYNLVKKELNIFLVSDKINESGFESLLIFKYWAPNKTIYFFKILF